jgi:pre-rRNA-processing protein TSR3
MVRHKKDNFARRGKRAFPQPRNQGHLQDDEEHTTFRNIAFKAACWDMGHCDPKKCSGKKLMHFGKMRELQIGQKFPGVVIS